MKRQREKEEKLEKSFKKVENVFQRKRRKEEENVEGHRSESMMNECDCWKLSIVRVTQVKETRSASLWFVPSVFSKSKKSKKRENEQSKWRRRKRRRCCLRANFSD